jgi:glyoxylase-like metal-dependent hydrolase (beta-lactamase superfamily II)
MSNTSEYQVVIVKYGTRKTVRSDVYLNYPLYGEADAAIEMDYFFWVLRNGERTVIIDTGFSQAGGQERNRTFLVDPARAYALLGVDRDAAPTVVITHAHYDHIGNLPLFPSSPLIIAETEYDFWQSSNRTRKMFHHSVQDEELEYLAAAHAAGRVTMFSDRYQVAPGIDVIRVGGHTPGQSVVKVQTSAGVVLLASDAVHYYEELDRDMLFMSVASLVDMYDGFDVIRAMLESGEIEHLVSGHDPATLGRFTPVTGELEGFAATIG